MLLMLKAAMLAGSRAMTGYEKIDPFKRDNKAKHSPIDLLLRQTVVSADNADSCDNRPCHRNRTEFHALAWLGTADSVIDLNAFLPACPCSVPPCYRWEPSHPELSAQAQRRH